MESERSSTHSSLTFLIQINLLLFCIAFLLLRAEDFAPRLQSSLMLSSTGITSLLPMMDSQNKDASVVVTNPEVISQATDAQDGGGCKDSAALLSRIRHHPELWAAGLLTMRDRAQEMTKITTGMMDLIKALFEFRLMLT